MLDRPADFVAGWFFPVPTPAFTAALDIERSERAETKKDETGEKRRRVWHVWSQRNPPQYAFMPGDVFHAPPIAGGPWAEQKRTLRWMVQVRLIEAKVVTIRVTQHRENITSDHDVSMDDLATLLRTGVLPSLFDFSVALAGEEA